MKKILNKKLKKSSQKWITRQINDSLVYKKKIQGYRSRSAFKLLEIDKKFKMIKNSSYVLDLGCFPGGWSQILSKKISKGKILATDILPMERIKNVNFILGDFLTEITKKKILELLKRKIDIVISDMAVNTTGNKNLDSYRTAELNLNAMLFSRTILNAKGVFLSKLFMGSEFKVIEKRAKMIFEKVIFFKPKSSRKDSRELYIYCKNIIN